MPGVIIYVVFRIVVIIGVDFSDVGRDTFVVEGR
jgi:hypothetical protein